jgi:hypothetical protein
MSGTPSGENMPQKRLIRLQTSYASVSRLTCDWNTAKLENPNAYI